MNNAHEQKLDHIIKRMQADRSVDAPVDALKYAKDLFRTRVDVPAPTILERFAGILKIDLAPNRAAFGERSTGRGAARQMLFDSGDNAVDLRITSIETGFKIRGQILGDGFVNGSVQIGELTSKVDDMGGFRFESVAAGEYSLSVRGETREILIDELILR